MDHYSFSFMGLKKLEKNFSCMRVLSLSYYILAKFSSVNTENAEPERMLNDI